MISVTLQFPDALAASHALARMAAPEQFATAASAKVEPAAPAISFGQPGAVIAQEDRPDVGAPEAPPLPPLSTTPTPLADVNAAAAFGGAVVQAAPLVPVLPPAAPPAPMQPASIPPSAATAPTAVPGTVERDSTGLPWDARIHASTKTKVASGAWTAKRNVDPAFKAQVEADLRGLPAPAAAAPVAPPVAPPAPTLPPVALQTPAAPGAGPTTFAEMAAMIGAHFAGPNAALAQAACQNALAAQGLQHLGQLAGAPERIPAAWAEFTRLLG